MPDSSKEGHVFTETRRVLHERLSLNFSGQLVKVLAGEYAVPKAMHYKANSVIYFKGDVEDRIFILKGGRVSLNSNDIETGQEIHDYIQTGEFFGVKSALGKYPREENAVVLSDADVIMFSVPEFEQLVARNTRIIMKMLRVFSNQLRRMHAKVRSLLAAEEQVDPEEGLFRNGEYYMKKKQYSEALYAFNKYLTYYPAGRYNQEANKYAQTAEDFAQKYGQGKGPTAPGLSGAPVETKKPETGKQLSNAAKQYYDAVSLFSQQKYQDAMKAFKEIVDSGSDEEYVVKVIPIDTLSAGVSIAYTFLRSRCSQDGSDRHTARVGRRQSRVVFGTKDP